MSRQERDQREKRIIYNLYTIALLISTLTLTMALTIFFLITIIS